MSHMCPVCGYKGLPEPAYDGDLGSTEICYCCGFQFGYHDDAVGISHAEWRNRWIASGMVWKNPAVVPPKNWDPKKQLRNVVKD